MRLAFSTLGCPAWSLDRIVRAAVEYGYDGVEIRGIQEHVDLRDSPYFSSSERQAVHRRFEDSGLSIRCLGSSASFANQDKRTEAAEEARAYIDIAADLGCPLVRVFGGSDPTGGPRRETVCAVVESLARLAPYAEERKVVLILETHDAFSTGQAVAEVLAGVDHPSIGALWDLHHPFREGEAPDMTESFLRPYLRHCHVKDSRDGQYTLLGEGDVPIKEMLTLISQRSIPEVGHPWISLEWEKRWHPEIAEPEVALPQYASRLREYLGEMA